MTKNYNRCSKGFTLEAIRKRLAGESSSCRSFLTAGPRLLIVLTMIFACELPTQLHAQTIEIADDHGPPVGIVTRLLSASETAQQWRDESPYRYLQVYADFDGDGRIELAGLEMRFSRRENGTLQLVATGGDRSTDDAVLALVDMEELPTRGIDLVEPGEYQTACGKRLRTCLRGEPKTLKLTRPAISFFRRGSNRVFFYFDVDTRSWVRVDIDLDRS